MEVFGEPLTPQQVVDRICGDVRTRGLTAVLEYSKKLDKADLTPQSVRHLGGYRVSDPGGCGDVLCAHDIELT